MTQMTLLAPRNTDEAFWKFHQENPKVMKKLVNLTWQAKRSGRKRIGMKMLFELVRWHRMVRTRSDDFALNNSYTSKYVRLIQEEHPELADMFETRRLG